MNFKDFGQTLAAKRKEKALSQPRLAELCKAYGMDIKPSTLSKWETNINMPNPIQFFILCEILNIDDINETFGVATKNHLFSQLNKEGQEKVLEYTSLLIDSGKYKKEEPVTPIRKLPYFHLQPVAAGTGNYLDIDGPFEEIEVSDNVSDKADFGVRVSGDSMEPLYVNGQIIWIHKQDTLDEGDIGIFSLDGFSYVKKYHVGEHGIELISLNKKYPPIKVDSYATLHTFGRVVS